MNAVRIVQRNFGWKEVGDDDDWEVYWTDLSITIDRVMKLTKTQVSSTNQHTQSAGMCFP